MHTYTFAPIPWHFRDKVKAHHTKSFTAFTGNHGKRWARTGTVVATGPGPRQYAVRMDGSRNISIRNRNILKTFTEVADMRAEDVPQQHLDEDGGHAAQITSQ